LGKTGARCGTDSIRRAASKLVPAGNVQEKRKSDTEIETDVKGVVFGDKRNGGGPYGVLVHVKYRLPNVNGFSELQHSDPKSHGAYTDPSVRLTL
jgi:hypothetical protein